MRIEKNRIEAFSDGVMAIIVTIMMLNIPLPGSYSRESLTAFLFNIAVFFVSFIVVGAQWVKHLQLFTMCRDISEKVLWRNLLFSVAHATVYKMDYGKPGAGFARHRL